MSGFWICILIAVAGASAMASTTRCFTRNPLDGSIGRWLLCFLGGALVLIGLTLAIGPTLDLRTQRTACYRYGSATGLDVKWTRLDYFTGQCLQVSEGRLLPAGNDVVVHP